MNVFLMLLLLNADGLHCATAQQQILRHLGGSRRETATSFTQADLCSNIRLAPAALRMLCMHGILLWPCRLAVNRQGLLCKMLAPATQLLSFPSPMPCVYVSLIKHQEVSLICPSNQSKPYW
jgi:hypothetical protein